MIKIVFFTALFFLYLCCTGFSLGLSDDEAYYWVLSQRLAFGYAFHPPFVAWAIRVFHALGFAPAYAVRIAAAVLSSMIFFLSLRHLSVFHLNRVSQNACNLFALFWLFGLGWMMLPDCGLFLGFALAFFSTYHICATQKVDWKMYGELFLGAFFLMFSKYSAVLAVASCVVSLFFYSPKPHRNKALFWCILGAFFGVLPSLVWNFLHNWDSLLYQIHDRHQVGSISYLRWIGFWGLQLLFLGPLGMDSLFQFYSLRKTWQVKFFLIWILPAVCIFGIQPLFAPFKVHWSLIFIWPILLFGLQMGVTKLKFLKAQWMYAAFLYVLMQLHLHYPIIGWWFKDDPKKLTWDITNDFYGWDQLAHLPLDEKKVIVGSRYQTASQAAVAVFPRKVTFLPRSKKEQDEWPEYDVTDTQGPEIPSLKSPIYFVADNRYHQAPVFKNADCKLMTVLEKRRSGYLAKQIYVWDCKPELKN